MFKVVVEIIDYDEYQRSLLRELREELRSFRISCMTPDTMIRDSNALGDKIDAARKKHNLK